MQITIICEQNISIIKLAACLNLIQDTCRYTWSSQNLALR
jgi:hypothetical protein